MIQTSGLMGIRQFKRNTDTVRTFDIFFLVTNNDKRVELLSLSLIFSFNTDNE